MSGYIGTKAVLLSTTAATVTGSSTVGAGLTVDNDGATVLTVDRATSDGTIIDVQKDGTTVGSIGSNSTKLTIGGTGTYDPRLRFGQTNNLATVQPADNTGALADDTVNFGQPNYRFKDLYLSGGVYLGGTGAANKLDDYEEGTWTPTQGNFNTWSSPTFDAKYTKIGRMVFINLRQLTGTIGWSAQDQMGGLPFTPAQGGSAYAIDDGPSSDNGPLLIWSAGNVYFQKGNASETSLIFSAMYYTS